MVDKDISQEHQREQFYPLKAILFEVQQCFPCHKIFFLQGHQAL